MSQPTSALRTAHKQDIAPSLSFGNVPACSHGDSVEQVGCRLSFAMKESRTPGSDCCLIWRIDATFGQATGSRIRLQTCRSAAFTPLHRSELHRARDSSMHARVLKRPEGRAPGQCADAPR